MREEPTEFQFPIPFDPFRILLAMLEKFWQIALVGAVWGAIGVLAGVAVLRTTYRVPLVIAKESAPAFWKPDVEGPWQPRPLTQEALTIIAESAEVYALAGNHLSPPRRADAVKSGVEMQSASSEDLYEVRGRSKKSAEDAMNLALAYANGMIEATGEKRRAEAGAAVETFRVQLRHRREMVDRLGAELTAYSSKMGFFDSGSEVSGQVEGQKMLAEKLVEVRSQFEAKRSQLRAVVREGMLGPAEAELSQLRSSRTEAHSLVRAKVAELCLLEERVKELEASANLNIAALESELPPLVFNQAMRLQEELDGLHGAVKEYTALKQKWAAELTAMPAKALAVGDLKASLAKSLAAAVTIESRLKDAEYFAASNGSPLRVLRQPHIGDVEKRSGWMKGAILGAIGFLLGSGGMFVLVTLTEFFSKRLRTPLQTAITTNAMPKVSYPAPDAGRQPAMLREFWMKGVLRHAPAERRILFAITGEMENEAKFWGDLLAAASGSCRERVIFADISSQGLEVEVNGSPLPVYNPRGSDRIGRIDPRMMTKKGFCELAGTVPPDCILLVRWGAEPNGELGELSRHIDHWYLMASPQESALVEVGEASSRFRGILGQPAGAVLVHSEAQGRASRFISSLEEWFMEFRSQDGKQSQARRAA